MTAIGYMHVAMELWGAVFCLISSLCIYISREEKSDFVLLTLHFSNAILLFSDSIAWMFRGYPGKTGSIVVHISNFIVFMMSYLMVLIFTEYAVTYIGQDTRAKKIWRMSIWMLVIIAISMIVISQFNHMYYYFDENNYYHRNHYFFISQLFGIASALISAVIFIKYRKSLKKIKYTSLMFYILFPFLATLLQLFIYGISLLNIAMTISVLWMFIVLQIERGRKLREQGETMLAQAEQIVAQEREVSDMQRKIMLSQIQPHFLYNSLNTIYYLCEKDTEVAQKAINDFSEYLRGNLDSLKSNTPVPFEAELRHANTYLDLEKLRFGEQLKIVYHIEVVDFQIPSLSIQPLVENAVKHGVGKKSEGGTVTITSREVEHGYEVTVADDGKGFDPEKKQDDGRSHVGIENVRQRLHIMCNGTLTITSGMEAGTVATIFIPR